MAVLDDISAPSLPTATVMASPQGTELVSLPRIPYRRLRFRLEALNGARLPQYHGSLLRGAFGHALRRTVCAFGPAQPCDSCTLRRACVHTRLFETMIEDTPPPFLRGLTTSPRPYIFEPLSGERELAAGGALEFDLVLLGQAIELTPYAVLAVERMAAGGLGRDRHRFAVACVRQQSPQGDWGDVGEPGGVAGRAPAAALPPPAAVAIPSRVRLRFLTPTRIKVRDHLVPAVSIRTLSFAMLRRTLELAHFHVPGAAVDWNIRGLLEHAATVRLAGSDLHWRDWQRYSNRQQTKMTLGGFVGTLDIEGDLAPLWPLFRTAEILHVGKGATFGLGRFEIS